MTGLDFFDTIERLRRTAQPFCVATVVRTADLTSAKAGAKAAVTADGEILGHLGGNCVQRAVQTAAGEALQTGETRMISVRPSASSADVPGGIEVHHSGCPSGGTVDLFIEPYSLPPRLWVLGDTPIGRAIGEHGKLMGFRVEVHASIELPTDLLEPRDFVVIASQGRGDESALRLALASAVSHVAMIASARKASVLKERLEASGIAPAHLARIVAPAGLDLGAIDPHEIAISVLAQVIKWRRAKQESAPISP